MGDHKKARRKAAKSLSTSSSKSTPRTKLKPAKSKSKAPASQPATGTPPPRPKPRPMKKSGQQDPIVSNSSAQEAQAADALLLMLTQQSPQADMTGEPALGDEDGDDDERGTERFGEGEESEIDAGDEEDEDEELSTSPSGEEEGTHL